jgi:hypothetical protein
MYDSGLFEQYAYQFTPSLIGSSLINLPNSGSYHLALK